LQPYLSFTFLHCQENRFIDKELLLTDPNALCCWDALQACKALRSASQHGIQVLAQQVLHKLKQRWLPSSVSSRGGDLASRRAMLWRLPHTDAAAAALEAEAQASAAAAATAAAAAAAAAAFGDPDIPDAPSQPPNPRMSWSYWDELQAAVAEGTRSEESLVEDSVFLEGRHLDEIISSLISRGGSDSVAAAVLDALGLSEGSSRVVPTVLLVACKREQWAQQIIGDGPDNCAALHAAVKRLAQLAREVWLPLGLQAQQWGYGEQE
jgi:hypothetical protein